MKKDDILTGRGGNFAKYILEKESYISDNVFKITLKNISFDYAEIILNSSIVRFQLKQKLKGAVQVVINKQTINSLLIPLPPLKKQNEIAQHISVIRSQATTKKRSKHWFRNCQTSNRGVNPW